MKNLDKTLSVLALLAVVGLAMPACSESSDQGHAQDDDGHSQTDDNSHDTDDHDHAGEDHDADGHVHGEDTDQAHDDHDHGAEFPLPAAIIGDMTVELAQAHGPLRAGEEGHLVIKLPYTDNGATVVRAWIGGEDRTLSFVGRGEYAPSHDDYDIHAMAPDPLPESTMWWIEIEKPDGTKVVGSAAARLE